MSFLHSKPSWSHNQSSYNGLQDPIDLSICYLSVLFSSYPPVHSAPPLILLFLEHDTHAPNIGLRPAVLSAQNALCPDIHMAYSPLLSSLYSNVTCSVRHNLTTLLKIIILISLSSPSTPHSSYSVLRFIYILFCITFITLKLVI